MRKLAISLIIAFAFYVTAAAAQYGGTGGTQRTQGSSPSAQPGQTQPGAGGPGMGQGTSTTDQTGGTSTTNDHANKGEKKIRGCVQSQGGQYVLETKKGPVALTGQDVSAHVGHEVTVKGTWENMGGSSSAGSATSSSSGNEMSKSFNVTDVKMDSNTCKMKGQGTNMGTGAGTSGTTGTGSSTGGSSGTGTGTSGSSGSTGTTPPQ